MSATAPAIMATSMYGIINAVWVRATMVGESVIRVISHATPTPSMRCPKYEKTLAVQMLRKVLCLSGEKAPTLLLATAESIKVEGEGFYNIQQ